MIWFFGLKTCGIFAHLSGIEPISLALESKVLTIRLPEKSPTFTIKRKKIVGKKDI